MDYKKKAQLFLDVFQARQDVYGKKWVSSTQTKKDGSPLVGYAPQCENFWKDICYIKTKTAGKTCGNCEHQRYSQVTIESVIRHIKGEEEQCFYVIDPATNMVAFGAMDFDCKPGKEDRGHTFEDVSRCVTVLEEWGVLFHIARSTTNGFHLYVFLDKPIEANKMLAFFHQVCEETGLSEQARLGIKPIPEIFPKQAVIGQDGLGNAIKPPMIEPQILKGKNCWVDKNNVMIPADKQWDYMKKIAVANVATIEGVLERCGVDLSIYRSGAGNAVRKNGGSKTRNIAGMNNYVKPLPGTSIEKVLEGCAALRRLRDNCLAGKEPGHDEGFALFHVCMGTHDGLDWFRIHVPGWGKTDADIKQLQQSLDKNYNPRTCANLQGLGICPVGTKCFDRKPPVEKVHGQWVSRNDIPESQWPDPSPIRYAFGAGDDFLKKLMEEVDILDPEGDATILEGGLKEIISRSRVFDVDQQKELEKHIKSKKLIKPSIVKSLFAEMLIDSANDYSKSLEENDHVRIGDHWIGRGDDGHGYDIIERIKGRPVPKPLTRTTIEIHEIKQFLMEDEEDRAFYSGIVRCPDFGFEREFEINVSDWSDPSKLYTYMKNLCQHRLGVAGRKKMEIVGWAAEAFSHKQNLITTNTYRTTQGWYKDCYIMPSVIIDKAGVRENEEFKTDLSGKKHAKAIDFKILADDEYKDLLFHIKSDLFNSFPKSMIYIGMGQVVAASIRTALGINFKPTLWFEGGSGTGKSEITKLLQSFYGDFTELFGWNSTDKYISDVGNAFKDCALVIDDYKESLGKHVKAKALNVVQFSYDDVLRGTMTKTGEANVGKNNQSLMIASGEDVPAQESSVVSRMIIVTAPKRDLSKTKSQLSKCKDLQKEYNAVLPRFLHWFLNQDIAQIKKVYNENRDHYLEGTAGIDNVDRIAQNLALNRVAFACFASFMRDMGTIQHVEEEKFLEQHMVETMRVREFMMKRCEEEKQSNVFLGALKEMLASGEVSIQGLDGYDHEHSPRIGFFKSSDTDTIYLWPQKAAVAVMERLRTTGFTVNKNSLARQLDDAGVLSEKDKGSYQKVVRYGKGTNRVWVIKMASLGIHDATEQHLGIMTMPPSSIGGNDLDKEGLL